MKVEIEVSEKRIKELREWVLRWTDIPGKVAGWQLFLARKVIKAVDKKKGERG